MAVICRLHPYFYGLSKRRWNSISGLYPPSLYALMVGSRAPVQLYPNGNYLSQSSRKESFSWVFILYILGNWVSQKKKKKVSIKNGSTWKFNCWQRKKPQLKFNLRCLRCHKLLSIQRIHFQSWMRHEPSLSLSNVTSSVNHRTQLFCCLDFHFQSPHFTFEVPSMFYIFPLHHKLKEKGGK